MTLEPKFQSALPIAAYCLASITMTLVNKLLVSSFSIKMIFLMLSVQSFFSIIFLVFFNLLGKLDYRRFNQDDFKKWFPVSLSMALMLYTGGKSLQYLQVPLFTIFKNLTIILVAYGEYFLFKSTVSRLMLVSFFLMVLSSVIGGWNDIEFNVAGYLWMFSNCFSSAFFVLHMRRVIKLVNFKDFDTVYFNNLITAPIFFFLSLLTEDWTNFLNYYWYTPSHANEFYSYLRALVVSGMSAFAISYCSAWCIRSTSSTTYSMAGALNKLPIAIIAMIYFDDPVTVGGVSAILIGFTAGVVYSHAKNIQKASSPLPTNINPNSLSQDSLDKGDEQDTFVNLKEDDNLTSVITVTSNDTNLYKRDRETEKH